MICTFSELKEKEVINTATGERIGYIDDVRIDTATGSVTELIICGRTRMMGLLGKDDDIFISCSDIERMGSDTLLVKLSYDLCKANNRDG